LLGSPKSGRQTGDRSPHQTPGIYAGVVLVLWLITVMWLITGIVIESDQVPQIRAVVTAMAPVVAATLVWYLSQHTRR